MPVHIFHISLGSDFAAVAVALFRQQTVLYPEQRVLGL